jgi:hypothetical protein
MKLAPFVQAKLQLSCAVVSGGRMRVVRWLSASYFWVMTFCRAVSVRIGLPAWSYEV